MEDDTTVSVVADNGASASFVLNAGETRLIFNIGVGGWQGQGSAQHISADKPVSAIQFLDFDATIESTAFLPRESMSHNYGFPVDSQYAAVVCPKPTDVTFREKFSVEITLRCEGSGGSPGKLYFGKATAGVHIPAGSTLTSQEHPVYVIYQESVTRDERNLFGL